jgi:bifunctional DNA-binding transcriptional regulator/antitoxin component of YhaV-PrlF toxin-antitoxin module
MLGQTEILAVGDESGVLLPMEWLRLYDLKEGDFVNIVERPEGILIRKAEQQTFSVPNP